MIGPFSAFFHAGCARVIPPSQKPLGTNTSTCNPKWVLHSRSPKFYAWEQLLTEQPPRNDRDGTGDAILNRKLPAGRVKACRDA